MPVKKSLQEIADFLNIPFQGDASHLIEGVLPLDKAGKTHLSFLDNSAYKSKLKETQAAAVLLRESDKDALPEGVAAFFTETPYVHLAHVLAFLHPEPQWQAGVHASAVVDERAEVSPTAYVGAGAVLGAGVSVADGAYIGAHVVLEEGVKVGKNSTLHSHVSLKKCVVGARCILHQGVRVGQDGFGFAASPKGLVKVPQVGHVVIGDDVEIGANTTIDCGTLEQTVIGSGTKIDNLVQIGHNVRIGMHCVIVAQTGIAGSTQIGNGVVIGGQSAIAGHIRIADGVSIAARSGVSKTIEQPGTTWGGLPALPINEWRRLNAATMRLIKRKKGE